jgi:hypothetical protein
MIRFSFLFLILISPNFLQAQGMIEQYQFPPIQDPGGGIGGIIDDVEQAAKEAKEADKQKHQAGPRDKAKKDKEAEEKLHSAEVTLDQVMEFQGF